MGCFRGTMDGCKPGTLPPSPPPKAWRADPRLLHTAPHCLPPLPGNPSRLQVGPGCNPAGDAGGAGQAARCRGLAGEGDRPAVLHLSVGRGGAAQHGIAVEACCVAGCGASLHNQPAKQLLSPPHPAPPPRRAGQRQRAPAPRVHLLSGGRHPRRGGRPAAGRPGAGPAGGGPPASPAPGSGGRASGWCAATVLPSGMPWASAPASGLNFPPLRLPCCLSRRFHCFHSPLATPQVKVIVSGTGDWRYVDVTSARAGKLVSDSRSAGRGRPPCPSAAAAAAPAWHAAAWHHHIRLLGRSCSKPAHPAWQLLASPRRFAAPHCTAACSAALQAALEYVRQLYGVHHSRCVAAGDSGNDTLMLGGRNLAIGGLVPPARCAAFCLACACCLLSACAAACLRMVVPACPGTGPCAGRARLPLPGGTARSPGPPPRPPLSRPGCSRRLPPPPPPTAVVGNAQPELVQWVLEQPQEARMVVTDAPMARGILEGLARHGLY